MEIVWSDDAIYDYHRNIDYLVNKWSEDSATNFIQEVNAVIELIKINPKLYPKSDYQEIRKAVIRKQISLFYFESDNTIYLTRFWNTYQDPDTFKS